MSLSLAGISEEEKRRLLHCVVVGGGPTGVEFSGELSDFIIKDVTQRYAHVKDYIQVTLIEVCQILTQAPDSIYIIIHYYRFWFLKASAKLFLFTSYLSPQTSINFCLKRKALWEV